MIVPFGDEALLVVLGEVIDAAVNQQAHAVARGVRAARDESWHSPWGVPVPSYASVLVPYDAASIDEAEATRRLTALVARTARTAQASVEIEGPVQDIAVRYGNADGPDLETVADRTGLTTDQVIEAHASTVYTVYLLGFVPGFAYLGILPPELELPRRNEPRLRVPRGSVGIAGRQTAVYPFETPGGWHLIGRSDAVLWDSRRESPSLLRAGQRVRFVPEPRA